MVVGAIPGFCQPVSSLLHLAAAAVALVAAVPLVRLGRRSRDHVAALGVYAFCVIGALVTSGIYHALSRDNPARWTMRRLDYLAIWLLIAGTFTAVHVVTCKGFWRSGLLTIIWTYALVAVGLQLAWFATFSGSVGLLLYLGFGWIGLASIVKLWRQLGARAVAPLWYGGVIFSAGAVLDAVEHPVLIAHWVGPHEVFHVAVVAGLACHWLFIRRLLLAPAPAVAASVG
jgi:channel protein (hemolysin III family)